jgi:hypothetical protein
MKTKADSGTTTAAAEGASAPVAVRLSHSEGPGDMTAQAHRVFARVSLRWLAEVPSNGTEGASLLPFLVHCFWDSATAFAFAFAAV